MILTAVLAAVVVLSLTLPFALPLRQVPGGVAARVWLATLIVRALTGVLLALFVVFYLPGTEIFSLLTHWCWHAVLPLLATHLGLSGHQLGDAATVTPAVLLALSTVSVVWAIANAARAVSQMVRRRALGSGPYGSVIVGGGAVMVAAAGLSRPRVVISAGALTAFDDEELAASVAHEQGHIERGHRFVLVLAEICQALGRLVPGTRRAAAELSFYLERDADEFALARRHDRFALAGAICKAAGAMPASPVLASLGGGPKLVERVALLTADEPRAPRRGAEGLARAVAVMLTVVALGLAVSVPVAAADGVNRLSATQTVRHCPD